LYEAKRAGKNTYRVGTQTPAGDTAQPERKNGVASR
jgi:hypothetical protein